MLGLPSEVAEQRPLLCVIDDAQWLDRASAQAVTFVARRLPADSVVMVFVAQEPSDESAELPELIGRALLGNGDETESLYRETSERVGPRSVRMQLARDHLAYGEWLRRQRRRADAREQLRAAFEMFTAMGIEAFAARAERELLATGERVRRRTVETRDELTAQEAQVARLARDGLSNAEIGERMFISQHTVAYHLRKVFNKLEITSRNQLARVLPQSASSG